MTKLILFSIFGLFLLFVQGQIELDIFREDPVELGTRIKRYADKTNNETMDINKFMNLQYYSIIRVGSPAQTFKVSFSTLYAITWLPSSRCGWNEIVCNLHSQYDSSKSSTFQYNGKFVNLTDNEESLIGMVSVDHFHMDHVQVSNQSFIEATHISIDPFIKYYYDGFIGLALPNSNSIPELIPFFANMKRQGLVDKEVFSFYMNRDKTTKRAGKIMFGIVDRKHVVNDTIEVLDLVNKNEWRVKLDGVTAALSKTKSVPISGESEVIFDSSSDSIVGPIDAVEKIHYLLNAKYIPVINKYGVDCRRIALLPDIEFTFKGTDYIMVSKYYVQHVVFNNVQACFSPFEPNDPGQDFWQLGGAFMMQFYTEFDISEYSIRIGQTIF